MSIQSKGPCAVVDSHYPCIREITGYSFKISIVMSATDLTFEDTLKREADAQLIAAAPELLASIIALDEAFCRNNDTREERHQSRLALIAARAAITKATGAA